MSARPVDGQVPLHLRVVTARALHQFWRKAQKKGAQPNITVGELLDKIIIPGTRAHHQRYTEVMETPTDASGAVFFRTSPKDTWASVLLLIGAALEESPPKTAVWLDILAVNQHPGTDARAADLAALAFTDFKRLDARKRRVSKGDRHNMHGVLSMGLSVSALQDWWQTLQRKGVSYDIMVEEVVAKYVLPKTKPGDRYFNSFPDGARGPPGLYLTTTADDRMVAVIELAVQRATSLDQEGGEPPRVWIDIFAITQHPGELRRAQLQELEEAKNAMLKGSLAVWATSAPSHGPIEEMHTPEMLPVPSLGNPLERCGQLNVLAVVDEYTKALAQMEGDPGADATDVAAVCIALARLHARRGAFEHAHESFKRAATLQRRTYGERHRVVATTSNATADMLQGIGRYKEAEPLYEHARSVRMEALEQGVTAKIERQCLVHGLAMTLNNYAALHTALRRYREAEKLYEKALHYLTEALGSEHHNCGTTWHNLGQLYTSAGRLAEAGAAYEKALEIRTDQLGPDHPHTKLTVTCMASWRERAARNLRISSEHSHGHFQALSKHLHKPHLHGHGVDASPWESGNEDVCEKRTFGSPASESGSFRAGSGRRMCGCFSPKGRQERGEEDEQVITSPY